MRILYILLLTGIILASGPGVRAELVNAIAVIVNDAIVTMDEVESSVAPEVDLLIRQYRTQPKLLEEKVGKLKENRTELLVEHQLILHDFKTAGYNLPESIIDEEIQDRIRKRYGDRMTLTKTLQAEGITSETFRQRVREQFIIEALRAKNISSAIIISPHKIETYYVQHKDDFKVEDQVKLRMIVLNRASSDDAGATKKLAQEILAKIEEGASFAEMATIHSEGSQAKQGGDWGWVEKFNKDGSPVLRKELFDVAFALKAGQRSGVIETADACYLMLVEDRRPAHTKSLGEVRDEIEKNLLVQERARLQKKWIDRLKNKSFVRYF
ncbi:MAG: peptidylprolyl isomerase [Verrucomicrobia bacterium]|nr:peptidylprolyl isomerase [Verrucomicrobiota bacterium]